MKLIKRVRRWLIITAGAAIAAFGIGSFLAANGVMVGGVSGIATVVNYMTGFPVGGTALLLNIPIFIAGIIFLGRRLGVDTIYACFVFSAFIDLFGQFVLTEDVF